MIVEPKFKGFICTTAHPDGCRENVKRQIDYVENKESLDEIKNVLVIGAGAGYGLATSIVSGIACRANVLGVSLERESKGKRTASAGFYNTKAVKELFKEKGLNYINIKGDAFSNEVKRAVIEKIKSDMGTIDLVVYSLAAPKRKISGTDEVVNSYLKTTGEPLQSKTVDFHTGKITEVTIEPATQEEIDGTIKVMGGEDWLLWIETLKAENLLSNGVKSLAYSYIGPDVTEPIYREGTIGRAKKHLEATVSKIDDLLKDINGKSYVSVNKALVTQASSAIPIVSLYVSLLYKVMKEKGTHEGCIEQIYRMFSQLYGNEELNLDSEGRIRLDNFEMEEDIQEKIKDIWPLLNSETVFELTDVEGFRDEFFKLFGFGFANIDYKKDVEI